MILFQYVALRLWLLLKNVFIALFCMGLSSCSLVDNLVTPTSKSVVQFDKRITTQEAFDCVVEIVNKLSNDKDPWKTHIQKIDISKGFLDIGNYEELNTIGFRVKAIKKYNKLYLSLKGAGIYYVDLGVDLSMNKLKNGIELCLIEIKKIGDKNE